VKIGLAMLLPSMWKQRTFNSAAPQSMGELHPVKNCLELQPAGVRWSGQLECVHNKAMLVVMRIWPESWTTKPKISDKPMVMQTKVQLLWT
jgi:hypothetical protein